MQVQIRKEVIKELCGESTSLQKDHNVDEGWGQRLTYRKATNLNCVSNELKLCFFYIMRTIEIL